MSEVRAEMAATVLLVRVEPGRSVAVGDQLLVLESMKMEIPVVAEQAGTVAQVAVTDGSVVREGDLLLTLD
jgi:biotin carboxyl carrier protein